MPVYGLSEASLSVAFTPSGRGPRTWIAGGRELASVGAPLPGIDIDVRGGRIFVRGPSVMQGYFGNPAATREALIDGWLDTGDLGFVDGGELFVSGRAKDLVILRGVNHAPQEFEDALDGVDGVRPGCTAAVGAPTAAGLMHDVAIAGGGPAGLAAAIRAAQRGFRTVLFERSHAVPDKACGEGLMPSGVRELERLGIRIAQDRCAPFRGIRYLQEDGTVLEARFGTESGIGIRRMALGEALRDRALASGVDVRHCTVIGATALPGCIELQTDAGAAQARLLIAADGLHSPLRRSARAASTWPSCARAKPRTASRSCSGGSRCCGRGSGTPAPHRRCVEQGLCSSAFARGWG